MKSWLDHPRRIAGTVVAVALATCAAALSAGAQDVVPFCPDGDALVSVHKPAYLRQGESFSVTTSIGKAPDVARVTGLTASVDNGTPTPMAMDSTGDGRVTLIAPANAGTVNVAVDWVQDAGTSAACSGDEFDPLQVVADDAKVGDPGALRLSGRFRVRITGHAVAGYWTLTPTCDVFACTTKVRTPSGVRLTAKLKPNGSYRIVNHPAAGSGSCSVTIQRVNPLTGSVLSSHVDTIKPAIRDNYTYTLRPSGTGSAMTLSGTVRDRETATPRAHALGCKGKTLYFHLTAHLVP